MKKLTVKQHSNIQLVFLLIGAALALIAQGMEVSAPFYILLALAVACVIGGIAWRMVFIKCPYCGDKLTGSRVIPKYCPNCGKSLDTNPNEGE